MIPAHYILQKLLRCFLVMQRLGENDFLFAEDDVVIFHGTVCFLLALFRFAFLLLPIVFPKLLVLQILLPVESKQSFLLLFCQVIHNIIHKFNHSDGAGLFVKKVLSQYVSLPSPRNGKSALDEQGASALFLPILPLPLVPLLLGLKYAKTLLCVV